MIQIDKELLDTLFEQAKANERKRMNYDLRTSSNDGSQRMLNALLPGTKVAIHRHPHSSENVICICGRLDEILYDANGNETERIMLCPVENKFGCVVPANTWHTVEVYEPSVIYEAKDGRYGEDGSESWEDFKTKTLKTSSVDCDSPSPSVNSMPECSNADLARQPKNHHTVCIANSQSSEDEKPEKPFLFITA